MTFEKFAFVYVLYDIYLHIPQIKFKHLFNEWKLRDDYQ